MKGSGLSRLVVQLAIVSVVALAFCSLPAVARLAAAQDVTGDDLIPLALGAEDVPGFHLAGDAVFAGSLRNQLTRVFMADSGTSPDLTSLTIILSVARENNPCLPLVPASISSGLVFGDLNGYKTNFALLGSLGAGDVDMTATWSDLDVGRNDWSSVYAAAFMRGRLSIYMFYRSYAPLPDFDRFAALVLAQDARLQQAAVAAPDSPVGILLTTPVPSASTAPRDCYDVPGG